LDQSYSITLPPGIAKNDSDYATKGRWVDGNLVRFWKDRPQKWLGWEKLVQSSLGGPARGAISWTALDGTQYAAWGTDTKLWLLKNGTLYDITPVGLPPPPAPAIPVIGWGGGGWGAGGWGGVSHPALGFSNSRTWTLAKWGEDLIACPRGGALYHWDQSAGPAVRAAIITGAPLTNLGVFVTDDRTLVSLGAHDGTKGDPLRVAWAHRETLTNWAPSAVTTAGDLRVEEGNEIISVVKVRNGYLILTDISAHTFRFVGGNGVFALDRKGSMSGCLSPHGAAEIDGIAYWMGPETFYKFDGAVQAIECDVHAHVFKNLNRFYAHRITAGTHRAYGEIIWFYGDASSAENNRYVSMSGATWAIGELNRTTWMDSGVITNNPIATDVSGNIYVHNVGATADGQPIPYRLSSGDIEITDSQGVAATDDYIRLRKVVPDYAYISGAHDLTIEARGYPQGPATTKGPYPFSSATRYFNPKARGRSFRYHFSGTGDFRMGDITAYGSPDGGRG
jgi:hypothetical protein